MSDSGAEMSPPDLPGATPTQADPVPRTHTTTAAARETPAAPPKKARPGKKRGGFKINNW